MENTDRILEIFFSGSILPKMVIDGTICFNNFPKEDFKVLVKSELTYLSETEIDELYLYLFNKYQKKNGMGIDVFEFLKDISGELLTVQEDQPECLYSELLRWRGLTRGLGEDMLTCAFLAGEGIKHYGKWENFSWSIVLRHNNMQLNRKMQDGISENHFHLYGSAPAFQLGWINLMNEPAVMYYREQLWRLEKNRRSLHMHYYRGYKEDNFEVMHNQAALIRLSIFLYIYFVEYETEESVKAFVEKMQEIDLELRNGKIYWQDLIKIQTEIQGLRRFSHGNNAANGIDYALFDYQFGGINREFAGERRLIYQMLIGEVDGKSIPDILKNWFYAYLLIKRNFYEEMVQVNNEVGFANFSHYNSRSKSFLPSDEDWKRMVQHSVSGSLESGNIKNLEIRITPGKKMRECKNIIERLDQMILEKVRKSDDQKFYYVFHFPKRADDKLGQKYGITNCYRHKMYRKQLENQGKELLLFRQYAQKQASRVFGIDACSMEIGCRPEVFAPLFRRLSSHIVHFSNFADPVPQWKITYHVGEDFLDPVDGLRAIEEALLFLDLNNGDRLGHATVLGQNIHKWYEYKHYQIHLNAQDYLDNIVWLYHKLFEYNISSCEKLKNDLRELYIHYFRKLYGRFLDEEFIDGIRRIAIENDEKLEYTIGRNIMDGISDIENYYAAWKLRGNNPELYKKGYFDKMKDFLYMENSQFEKEQNIRAEILYFYYHFSADVRHAGKEEVVDSISELYIQAVERVQKEIQNLVAKKGVCIEANPSSNYQISTIGTYAEHPISTLFNLGLTVDPEEIRNCPQLNISVNTDDKGIFHTSLENEFALMARATEEMTDENGRPKYARQMIYDWMERIMKFGNDQRFCQ